VFRWLATKFLSAEAQYRAGVNAPEPAVERAPEAEQLKLGVVANAMESMSGHSASRAEHAMLQNQTDAPPCNVCGSIMVRSGSCYKCANCGSTSGCA
jgi:ribonucleoside-diphosphate reductase alpha chain